MKKNVDVVFCIVGTAGISWRMFFYHLLGLIERERHDHDRDREGHDRVEGMITIGMAVWP